MRILITGGGTGGHVFPALEIAKAFRQKDQSIEILLVGNRRGLEQRMAEQAGFRFFGLSAKKMVGQSLLKKFLALIFLQWAIFRCVWLMVRTRPYAVIGVGGYVSAPALLAGALLGIRRYICEQNVVPGMANRYLAKIAKKVFISFEQSSNYFPPKKTVLSGNPVRQEFFSIRPKPFHSKLQILVTGGSMGAHYLNENIPESLKRLHESCPDLVVTHQTGQSMCEDVKKRYQMARIEAQVLPFIQDMPRAFAEHHLVISRAGATVCSEILASSMPAILIPYPHANAHQRFNALALSNGGAAILIEEGDDFFENLSTTLKDIYRDPTILPRLSRGGSRMMKPDAAKTVVKTVFEE